MLIEMIGRQTHNKRSAVVNQLGVDNITRIYMHADVLHCENPITVVNREIKQCKIKRGRFDNVLHCRGRLPSETEIGRVYARLIDYTCDQDGTEPIPTLISVYNNYVSDRICDYNCAAYWDTTPSQYVCYKRGYF
jgi:hypothetical protein